jgi:hypothetical protein
MSPDPAWWTLIPVPLDQAFRLATISGTSKPISSCTRTYSRSLRVSGAADFDAHVLRLQQFHDPRQRGADRVGAVAGFAQGGLDQGFGVHGCPG